MKTVILDGYTANPGDLSWDFLSQFGEYTVYDYTRPEEIVERAKDCDILIVNKAVITAETMAQLPKLKLIALLSTGFNVIDVEWAKEHNILVANVPSYSSTAVAQLVFAFILEHTNKVALHNQAVKDGQWSSCRDFCFWKAPLMELAGKTMGIIGYGQIGHETAAIAKAFHMNVIAYSRSAKIGDSENGVLFVSLDDIAKNSDFLSLHCPLNAQTEKMIDKAFIEKMKKNAFIVNTSRGPVIDDDALAEALEQGRIAGAAVDVLTCEPPEENNPLIKSEHCLNTPHIAWAGFETRQRLLGILEDNIKAFLDGHPQNIVNR